MAKKPPAAPEAEQPTLKNSRPYDIDAQQIADLFEEASMWLDGSEITTEAEAEGVERLLKLARAYKAEADEHRAAEAKPFDDGKKEVQARFLPLIRQTDHIINGTKHVLTKWREKLRAAQEAAAEETRRAAEEAAEKAARAAKLAQGNLAATVIADNAQEDAERLARSAERAARDAGKGLGLRTYYDVEVTDLRAAAGHYYKHHPDKFTEFVKKLAEQDSRSGRRDIPGITYTERKGAY